MWKLAPDFKRHVTCTCQVSGRFSFEDGALGPMMSGILSILSKASSYDDLFNFSTPWGFEAFNQRSSKLVRTSYAAGPSILQCKSCHGSLGQPRSGPYFKIAQVDKRKPVHYWKSWFSRILSLKTRSTNQSRHKQADKGDFSWEF